MKTKELDMSKTYLMESSEDTGVGEVSKMTQGIKEILSELKSISTRKRSVDMRPLITPREVINKIAIKLCENEDEFINQCFGHEEELTWFVEILKQVQDECDKEAGE